MVMLEIAGGVVLLGLAFVTAYMAIMGGLGMIGAVHFVRCMHCGHLVAMSGTGLPEQCVHCQHVVMYHHPIRALHHAQLWQWRAHFRRGSRISPSPPHRGSTGR